MPHVKGGFRLIANLLIQEKLTYKNRYTSNQQRIVKNVIVKLNKSFKENNYLNNIQAFAKIVKQIRKMLKKKLFK